MPVSRARVGGEDSRGFGRVMVEGFINYLVAKGRGQRDLKFRREI